MTAPAFVLGPLLTVGGAAEMADSGRQDTRMV